MFYIVDKETGKAVNEYETRGEASKDLPYWYAFAHAPKPKRNKHYMIADESELQKQNKKEEGEDA